MYWSQADKTESARATKLNECLENMKRLFPGVLGRLIDLCKPRHRKHNIAVTVILGKNMDAIVV